MNVGIIGGADGPTAILVSSLTAESVLYALGFLAVSIAVMILIRYLYNHHKDKR